MDFPSAPNLTGGVTYTAVLSTGPDVADVQSQAYFIKPGTVALANPDAPQPQLIKDFSVSSLTVGQTATMTLSLSNNGTVTVNSVAFTDTLPTGMTFPSTTVNSTCGGTASISGAVLSVSGVSLSAGSSCSISTNISVTQAGTLTNTTSTVSSDAANSPAAAATASITGVTGTPTLTFWGMAALVGLLVAFATPKIRGTAA